MFGTTHLVCTGSVTFMPAILLTSDFSNSLNFGLALHGGRWIGWILSEVSSDRWFAMIIRPKFPFHMVSISVSFSKNISRWPANDEDISTFSLIICKSITPSWFIILFHSVSAPHFLCALLCTAMVLISAIGSTLSPLSFQLLPSVSMLSTSCCFATIHPEGLPYSCHCGTFMEVNYLHRQDDDKNLERNIGLSFVDTTCCNLMYFQLLLPQWSWIPYLILTGHWWLSLCCYNELFSSSDHGYLVFPFVLIYLSI